MKYNVNNFDDLIDCIKDSHIVLIISNCLEILQLDT